MEIVDPPAPKGGGRSPSEHWLTITRRLREEYPGKYAKVGNYSNGVATQIRHGVYGSFIPPGVTDRRDYMDKHWVITSRNAGGNGRKDLYVKWVGAGCVCRYCQ